MAIPEAVPQFLPCEAEIRPHDFSMTTFFIAGSKSHVPNSAD